MTFIEKYNKIMGENARRQHAVKQHVVKTYEELLNSVGAYTDEKLEKDDIPLNGLVNRPEGGNEGEVSKPKDEDKKETPKTKYDAVKAQVETEFTKDGVNKTYRDSLEKDGYKMFVKMIDDLDLWREYPATS
jgi:hypothetical protein